MAVKMMVVYSQPENPEAFDKQYFESHLPLAEKMPGLRRLEVSKAEKNLMGGDLPFYMIAEMTFDSHEDLNAAMKSDEGKAAADNLMSFAGKYVTFLVADVQVKEGSFA